MCDLRVFQKIAAVGNRKALSCVLFHHQNADPQRFDCAQRSEQFLAENWRQAQ